MNAHKQTSLKRTGKLNCWRTKHNKTQRTLGSSRLTKNTSYSHSISKDPSQKNADLKKGEKSAALSVKPSCFGK